jgi:ABC-type sugar transport system substrate-binding protein
MNDSQAVAIVDAAEAAGLNPGPGAKDLVIVGSNCVPETIGAIRSGKLYSSASQIPTRLGVRAADAAADYFSGKTLPKTIHLPVDVINKANLDQWVGPCTY